MTDADWNELQRLMAEQSAEEARWLAEGGSYLCAVHSDTYIPCRKCARAAREEKLRRDNSAEQ